MHVSNKTKSRRYFPPEREHQHTASRKKISPRRDTHGRSRAFIFLSAACGLIFVTRLSIFPGFFPRSHLHFLPLFLSSSSRTPGIRSLIPNFLPLSPPPPHGSRRRRAISLLFLSPARFFSPQREWFASPRARAWILRIAEHRRIGFNLCAQWLGCERARKSEWLCTVSLIIRPYISGYLAAQMYTWILLWKNKERAIN